MSKWEELEKAARAATPGPWVADKGEVWGTHPMRFNLTTGGTPMIAKMCEHPDSERPFPFVENAAYLAAANPSAILELLAERDALKAELDRIRAMEPVAWRTFDGEGGYDYRTYDMNEDYAEDYAKRNPKYAHWVEPLYTLEKKP